MPYRYPFSTVELAPCYQRSAFGQSVGLREGVARMAEWARRVGSRKTAEFTDIEIPYGLPEGW